jgi:hypothetical protein
MACNRLRFTHYVYHAVNETHSATRVHMRKKRSQQNCQLKMRFLDEKC